MYTLYLAVALAVITPSTFATCDTCMTTYGSTGKKCTDIDTAWACILGSTDSTCIPSAENSPAKQSATKSGSTNTLFNDGTDADPSCIPSAVCLAQAVYASAIAARSTGTTTTQKCKEAITYAQAVGVAASNLNACDRTTTQSAQYDTAVTMVKADCGFSYAVGLRPSVVILAIALFLSYLKF